MAKSNTVTTAVSLISLCMCKLSLKMQGHTAERDLLAGAARAVHWPDVTRRNLRLCLRLHEAGWQWSGGFALDTPGDLFVKIRHRSAVSFNFSHGVAQ